MRGFSTQSGGLKRSLATFCRPNQSIRQRLPRRWRQGATDQRVEAIRVTVPMQAPRAVRQLHRSDMCIAIVPLHGPFSEPPHPGGMSENSPTFQRWGREFRGAQVPKGRLKPRAIRQCAIRQPSLRDLSGCGRWFPTLKRWAILACPSGTKAWTDFSGLLWAQILVALDMERGHFCPPPCAVMRKERGHFCPMPLGCDPREGPRNRSKPLSRRDMRQ